jgi:outer membrane protein assembly factor BamB
MKCKMMFRSVPVVMMCLASVVLADDWPQWMGPHRNDEWTESGIVTAIPEQGLQVKWRSPLGLGYAGPAVANHRVYVLDYQLADGKVAANPGTKDELKGQERIVCLSAETGDEIWAHAYDQPYAISYGSGPRTTPTIDGDRAYALGAEGRLTCLNADSGKVVWEHDLKAEYGAQTPHWGHSAHPLVNGDLLITLAGGDGSAVIAFNKQTGKEVWKALSAKDVGYCPPTMAESVTTPQLMVWLPDAVHGLNPDSGEVLWTQPLVPDFGMSIAVPAQHDGMAFFSGVRNKSLLLKLDSAGGAPEVLWEGKGSTSVSSAHSSPLIVNDTIYGNDEKGWVRAVDLKSGDRLWETLEATALERPANYATAFVVRNGEHWYLFNDSGDLIIAQMNRNGYKELGKFHVLEPTGEAMGRPVVWSHPAFADRCLFARNDKEIVCVSLQRK